MRESDRFTRRHGGDTTASRASFHRGAAAGCDPDVEGQSESGQRLATNLPERLPSKFELITPHQPGILATMGKPTALRTLQEQSGARDTGHRSGAQVLEQQHCADKGEERLNQAARRAKQQPGR